jgi:hypothetical protein
METRMTNVERQLLYQALDPISRLRAMMARRRRRENLIAAALVAVAIAGLAVIGVAEIPAARLILSCR